MFSYTVSVRKIPNSKLKAICSLTIDDVLIIDGFKIIDGSNGLFVSVPSHKGTVVEDGNKVEKYFDDIRFAGDAALDVSKEIKEAILAAYSNGSSASQQSKPSASTQSQVSAKADNVSAKQQAQKTQSSGPVKKPLWGF